MKQLYYVRHGDSLMNDLGLWGDTPGSKADLGLSDAGKQQVLDGAKKALAAGIKPDLIICSPLERTRETAAIIAEILGFPKDKIKYNDLFLEIQVGELEGTSFADFMKEHTYADLGKFKGAESIEMLQVRAEQALDYAKTMPEETILIVAHSCFGRAFRRVVEDTPYTDEFSGNNAPLPYGEILKLI